MGFNLIAVTIFLYLVQSEIAASNLTGGVLGILGIGNGGTAEPATDTSVVRSAAPSLPKYFLLHG